MIFKTEKKYLMEGGSLRIDISIKFFRERMAPLDDQNWALF